MSTPIGLAGMVLLFWGWQIGYYWVGAAIGLGLELSRLNRKPWSFTQKDLDQIWDFCVLLFLASVVLAFVAGESGTALVELAQDNSPSARLDAFRKSAQTMVVVLGWLPLVFLPIVVAQALGSREFMDWSTFSWWLRTQRNSHPLHPTSQTTASKALPPPSQSRGIDVTWPFFALCLFSASAGNRKGFEYAAGFAFLLGWASWANRPKSYRPAVWAGCMAASLLAAAGVFAGMVGMQALNQKLQAALGARFAGNKGFDSTYNRTSLGSIGQIKTSGSILLRVNSSGQPPELLREASYSYFRHSHWSAPKQNFISVSPAPDSQTWRLLGNKTSRDSIQILRHVPKGPSLLAVPQGTGDIGHLPVGELQTNAFGAIQIADTPGFIQYETRFDPGWLLEREPDSGDLDVPALEKPALTQIIQQAGLEGLGPRQAVEKLGQFLQQEFQYSIWLKGDSEGRTNATPLTRFLTDTRAGHCELFATASALALRELGIPTRYVSGFAVQEKRGKQWIVRGRHAHAWCIAWIDGVWREVDHTPASWTNIEGDRARVWEQFGDLFSNLWLEFSKLRHGDGQWKSGIPWVMALVVAYAAWRVYSGKQWKRAGPSPTHRPRSTPIGADSEFYQIQQELEQAGFHRRIAETPDAWIQRVLQQDTAALHALNPILRLHYRLRYDPDGLPPGDRAMLRQSVSHWCSNRSPRPRSS